MKESLKSILALIVIISGALAVMSWCDDYTNRSATTIWTIRIVSPLLFFGIIYFLFWLEFRRDKTIKPAKHTSVLEQLELLWAELQTQTGIDQEFDDRIAKYLEHSYSMNDLFREFGGRKNTYDTYSAYMYKRSIQEANASDSGALYQITWSKKYDSGVSAIKNLVNVITLPFGLSITSVQVYQFITIHRYSTKNIRKIKLKNGIFTLMQCFLGVGVISMLVVAVWNIGQSIMANKLISFSSLIASLAIIAIGFLQYLIKKITDFGLTDELKEISRSHFSFVHIEKIANDNN